MHVIVVTLKIRPDAREAFLGETRRHIRWTLDNEPGCRQFDLSIAKDDPNTVVFYEVYADDAALKAHGESPSLKTFRERTASQVESRTAVYALRQAEP